MRNGYGPGDGSVSALRHGDGCAGPSRVGLRTLAPLSRRRRPDHFILVKWINNLATVYEVTPERLIIRRGIFNKSIDEIELYRVKNIRIDFSLINQWADIGTISILSSDETTRDASWSSRMSTPRAAAAKNYGRSSTRHARSGTCARSICTRMNEEWCPAATTKFATCFPIFRQMSP